MNSFRTVGNLAADPELKFGNSGKPYARLRVAESRGEGKESTFYDVTAFDDLAENVVDSLHKGDRVIIDGYFNDARTYETSNGETRISLNIVATDIAPSLRWATVAITRNPKRETPNNSRYDEPEKPF